MVVHGGKVAQLTVHGGKVPRRCSLWGQKVVSPNFFLNDLLQRTIKEVFNKIGFNNDQGP